MSATVAAKTRSNGTTGRAGGKNGKNGHAEAPADEAAQRELLSALRGVAKGDFTIRLSTARKRDRRRRRRGVQRPCHPQCPAAGRVPAHLRGRRPESHCPASVAGLRCRGVSNYVTSVNELIDDLTTRIAEASRRAGRSVRAATCRRRWCWKSTAGRSGRVPPLGTTINTMVDQLNSFAAEVTRVANEVGTEGKLGGQAQVQGVAGTWKDLTDNVNSWPAT